MFSHYSEKMFRGSNITIEEFENIQKALLIIKSIKTINFLIIIKIFNEIYNNQQTI